MHSLQSLRRSSHSHSSSGQTFTMEKKGRTPMGSFSRRFDRLKEKGYDESTANELTHAIEALTSVGDNFEDMLWEWEENDGPAEVLVNDLIKEVGRLQAVIGLIQTLTQKNAVLEDWIEDETIPTDETRAKF